MRLTSSLPAALAAFLTLSAHVHAATTGSINGTSWYAAEVAFLADLKSRVTGTPNHNKLIDHIQAELELLGLTVYTDTLNFTFLNQPLSQPSLTVNDQSVNLSSYAPYSGITTNNGISASLVDLTGPADLDPDWSLAKGKIAVLNITNSPANYSATLSVWPDQPPWGIRTSNPDVTAEGKVANMTEAHLAGVAGVIYVWQHITADNARGQYVPFKRPYQGVPAVYVAGDAANTVTQAVKTKEVARLTLTGNLMPDTATRTIW
jgi:hypothetical protein